MKTLFKKRKVKATFTVNFSYLVFRDNHLFVQHQLSCILRTVMLLKPLPFRLKQLLPALLYSIYLRDLFGRGYFLNASQPSWLKEGWLEDFFFACASTSEDPSFRSFRSIFSEYLYCLWIRGNDRYFSPPKGIVFLKLQLSKINKTERMDKIVLYLYYGMSLV